MQSSCQLRTNTVLLIIVGSAIAGACTVDSSREERTQQHSQPVTASIPDETLQAAANCPGCSVINRADVVLPLTGRRFTEAKLASNTPSQVASVALDQATHAVVDPKSLQTAEEVARFARQGRFTDELYASDCKPVRWYINTHSVDHRAYLGPRSSTYGTQCEQLDCRLGRISQRFERGPAVVRKQFSRWNQF
jgi:hypothetical protein